MKQVIEDYAHFIFYSLLAVALLHSFMTIFNMHKQLFKFETVEFKAERMFNLEDIPVIYANHQYLTLNESFEPLKDVYALDKKDGRIENLNVEGYVDTSKSGMYQLTYSVVNSLGFHNQKEIFVWVENYEDDD